MGIKKITDLPLISSITDGISIPTDDGITTYRLTALQMKNYANPDLGITLAKLAVEVSDRLFPTGSIVNLATSAVPNGFLKTNGAAISRTTYANLFAALVTTPGFTIQTFTVTIATPAVVTKATHGFKGGERLRLSTTGALPTGLSNSVDYFVWYIDANTFRLQTITDVIAGTFVNTSGTQSGTHSYTRSLWGLGDGTTTFNVPDLRGFFVRAWDDARGIDLDRAIAAHQMDAIKNITGAIGGKVMGSLSSGGALLISGSVASLYGGGGGNGANISFDAASSSGARTTADDNRPKSIALMPVIKY